MTRQITNPDDLRFDHPDGDGAMPNAMVRAVTKTTLWAVHVYGWMTLIEAPDWEEALVAAAHLAPSASLLPSDIYEACGQGPGIDTGDEGFEGIRVATPEDIEHVRAMAAPIGPDERQRRLDAALTALSSDVQMMCGSVRPTGDHLRTAVETLRARADQLEGMIG
jgi:hypothetical protein